MSSTWPPERIEKAAALWREGMSASQIGARMGCSRSAILGLRHRNKQQFPAKRAASTRAIREDADEGRPRGRPRGRALVRVSEPSPTTPVRVKEPDRQESEAEIAAIFARPIEARRDLSAHVYPGSVPVAFAALEAGECRFPLLAFEEKAGPASPFCGRSISQASPAAAYCDFHHRIVWRVR